MPSRSTEPGAVLAIDLGLRRTGLARSDPERTVALGLPTFLLRPGRSLKAHLRALAEEQPLSGVVLGMPYHMDGRPGDLAPRVRRLGEWIAREMGIPVAYQDERLTSEEAADLLREAPPKVRQARGSRDCLAAQLILREFLAAGCPFSEGGGSA